MSSISNAMKVAWNMTCPWSNLTCKLCPWLLTSEKKLEFHVKVVKEEKECIPSQRWAVFKTLIRSGHIISRTCAQGTRSKKPCRKFNYGTFHTTLNLDSWSPAFKNEIFCTMVGLQHNCTSTQIELSRIVNNCTWLKINTTLWNILKGPRLPC